MSEKTPIQNALDHETLDTRTCRYRRNVFLGAALLFLGSRAMGEFITLLGLSIPRYDALSIIVFVLLYQMVMFIYLFIRDYQRYIANCLFENIAPHSSMTSPIAIGFPEGQMFWWRKPQQYLHDHGGVIGRWKWQVSDGKCMWKLLDASPTNGSPQMQYELTKGNVIRFRWQQAYILIVEGFAPLLFATAMICAVWFFPDWLKAARDVYGCKII